MKRAYYSDRVSEFLCKGNYEIFGEITSNDQFASDELQKNTWKAQIDILKRELAFFTSGTILFEYTIPRIGNRIDNILIYKGIVFLLEFKVGESSYPSYAIEQVTDYALDLKCFHKESHDKLLVPLLIATCAPDKCAPISFLEEKIIEPICCNATNIGKCIANAVAKYSGGDFSAEDWIDSLYMPTPTIIEAAQALYRGHDVKDISRSDASAINLGHTTKAINNIIDFSKTKKRKSICFITGVPGSGKTLAGLNISIERQKVDENEHAVFLSGNGPLVDVLQEALARDDNERNGTKKSEALRKAKGFIQIIHHFRDELITTDSAPVEKVVIFDESQRAWTEEMLIKFMRQKKGVLDFKMSEPEFLISVMDRHSDWTTVICLVGGGQEINTGEAGLTEWFKALKRNYPNWDVYVSNEITDKEYLNDIPLFMLLRGMNHQIVEDLHLSVSLRSFRSEKVSSFVKTLLDAELDKAKHLYLEFENTYPIVMTRNLHSAKEWVKNKAKGSQRYGLIASSGAKRLSTYGIWVQNKIDAPIWFLNGRNDVRSSFFLEETATEFDIQGLELDWTIICWDANFRFNGRSFEYYSFTGSRWMNINKKENTLYLKNAYRVLLTRARQGFVIFIPSGDADDDTRDLKYYNGIYDYLKEIGISEI